MGTQGIKVVNPFKDATMRREFDAAVKAYEIRHRDLFHTDGSPKLGSSFASFFWRGYDGTKVGAGFIDRASRQIIAYAYYRAGQLVKRAETVRGIKDRILAKADHAAG